MIRAQQYMTQSLAGCIESLLPRFKLMELAPVEEVYSVNFELLGYFLILGRDNYPFPLYVKVDKDLSRVEEVYPYMIGDKKLSVKILREDVPVSVRSSTYYFSWNIETNDTSEDYIKIDGALCKVKNDEILTRYEFYYPDTLNEIRDKRIRDFLEKRRAAYAALYIDADIDEVSKIIAGYQKKTFLSDK